MEQETGKNNPDDKPPAPGGASSAPPRPRPRRRRGVARYFLAAFLGMLFSGIGFGLWLAFSPEAAAPPPKPAPSRFDVVVSRVRHNAMRNGALAWTVDAESVGYSRLDRKARIRKVSMVFYSGSGRPVTAGADEGSIDTTDRNVELSGSVHIKDDPYTFKTDRMFYRDQDRKIEADRPVDLSGKRLSISGDALSYDLNSRTVHVRGHVKGTFFFDGNA